MPPGPTDSIHQAKVRFYPWNKQTKPPGPPASGDPVFVWMKTEGESKRVKILCHSLHIFPDFGSFLELIGYDPEKNSIKILLVIKWRTPFLSWFRRVNPISFSSRKVHIFWEGHKILRNLHLTFVLCTNQSMRYVQCKITPSM